MDLDKIAAKVVEAGGGISDSALYGRIKRALQSAIRDIEKNFINVSLKYKDREVSGAVDGHEIKFFYNIIRASNGEVAGLPVLVVDGKTNKNFYGKISGELAKMLKETGGKEASVRVAKINQRGYKFWVVVDGKIESGWEYTEDAKDQLENLPAGKKGKVLAKAGLRQLGLDPDDDNAWHQGRIASSMTKVAGELVKIARELVGAMPYGRDAGNVKRMVGQLLKRAGWDIVNISEDRSGAGFNVHATRKVEQLPDVRAGAGRTNEDLLAELQRETKPLEKQLEQKLNPKPEEVRVMVHLSRHGEMAAQLYVWLKYDVGGTVTPTEFL